jgi:hypothetical protein
MSIRLGVSLVLILLFTISFTGCTLLQTTEFNLISSSVVDEDGFVALKIEFNISNTATVNVFKPNGIVIFKEEHNKGVHTSYAYLDEYKITPDLGNYRVRVNAKNGDTIFEDNLIFTNKNITINTIEEYWWKDDDNHCLFGLKINLKNNGDLPVYPYEVDVSIGNKASSWYILPDVIMPNQIKDFYCCLIIENIPSMKQDVSVNVKDIEGDILSSKSYTLIPDENLNDIRYNWRFIGSRNLVIPDLEFLYDYYSNLERLDATDYAAYEFDRYDNHFTDWLSEKVRDLYDSSNDVSIINFIASFVQNLKYLEDSTECDYPRYPIEHLKDKEGDCEDKAILAASILRKIGYNVSLIQLPKHVAVGVNLDEEAVSDDYFIDQYYFLETSSTGWFVGKVPPEHKGKTNITVYTLESRPVLIHSWKNATRFTDSEGSDYIKMKIAVENLGERPSGAFTIQAAFFSLDGNIVNEKTIDAPSISVAKKSIVELEIDVPQGITTKLKTRVYLDDIKVHQRESLSEFP